MNEIMDEKIFLIYIFYYKLVFISNNHQCLDIKRLLVYAYKTIDMSSSHGVHYLVHNSAL